MMHQTRSSSFVNDWGSKSKLNSSELRSPRHSSRLGVLSPSDNTAIACGKCPYRRHVNISECLVLFADWRKSELAFGITFVPYGENFFTSDIFSVTFIVSILRKLWIANKFITLNMSILMLSHELFWRMFFIVFIENGT